MLKNIKNLRGAETLNSDQQKAIQGGDALCFAGCAGKQPGDRCHMATVPCRTLTVVLAAHN
ncbi:hypothetical protein [Aureitalea marina]|uniref:Uncharacterized protein n=1 Tax=Aureitalea marina TaxID=930804 RepID=A0A2S7KLQ5_9FLAO|nr:hypothetical protein [Aureitalea marina]PQB03569.1 hypothetical protein BST85_00645 [Aureitalea marina]